MTIFPSTQTGFDSLVVRPGTELLSALPRARRLRCVPVARPDFFYPDRGQVVVQRVPRCCPGMFAVGPTVIRVGGCRADRLGRVGGALRTGRVGEEEDHN